MKPKILFVDDNQSILSSMQRQLRREYEILTAISGSAAIDLFKTTKDIAVIVTDMRMPGMDGIELLRDVQKLSPDTIRIMLTGNADHKTAMDAVNEGKVFQFLTKPFAAEDMEAVLSAAVEHYKLKASEKQLLNDTLNGIANIFAELIAITDPEAYQRSLLVRDQMAHILKQFNILDSWEYLLAASLSSIGYLTIPYELRRKVSAGDALTQEEQQLLGIHPEIGYKLVSKIPRMEKVAEIILYQNKNFDGSGFPKEGISGEDIHLGARIIHALNDFNSLTQSLGSAENAVGEMKLNENLYGEEALDAIRAALSFTVMPAEQLESAGTTQEEPRNESNPPVNSKVTKKYSKPEKLTVKDLKPGLLVLTDIKSTSGVLILPRGNHVTEVSLQRIQNYHRFSGIIEPIIAAFEIVSEE